ncbi:MAG: DHH family phosphoesterase [Clostridia bacterium]|nr:DHH family phosphoesterase [Clostridia bacterium]
MKEGLLEVLVGKKITIIGHDSCDIDSFISAKLLSKLLDFLNVNNEVLILDSVEEDETYKIVKENFQIDLKDYYCNFEDEKRHLFLVDHYETKHFGSVIACIDHHPNQSDIVYPYYYFRRSCSTSYLIYELMQEFGYIPNVLEMKMIILSMMVDTMGFRSEKTVAQEVIVAKSLMKKYGFSFNDLERISLCLTDISHMSVDEIIYHGVKSYNYNGKNVKSSYLQLWEEPSKEKLDIWLKALKQIVFKENIEMWVFIIFTCRYSDTYEYHIKKDRISSRIDYGRLLSRGTNIMPRIEKLFEIK